MVCYTADVQAKGAITCPNACASGLHGRFLICQLLRLAARAYPNCCDVTNRETSQVMFTTCHRDPSTSWEHFQCLPPGLVEAALVSFFVMKID